MLSTARAAAASFAANSTASERSRPTTRPGQTSSGEINGNRAGAATDIKDGLAPLQPVEEVAAGVLGRARLAIVIRQGLMNDASLLVRQRGLDGMLKRFPACRALPLRQLAEFSQRPFVDGVEDRNGAAWIARTGFGLSQRDLH